MTRRFPFRGAGPTEGRKVQRFQPGGIRRALESGVFPNRVPKWPVGELGEWPAFWACASRAPRRASSSAVSAAESPQAPPPPPPSAPPPPQLRLRQLRLATRATASLPPPLPALRQLRVSHLPLRAASSVTASSASATAPPPLQLRLRAPAPPARPPLAPPPHRQLHHRQLRLRQLPRRRR